MGGSPTCDPLRLTHSEAPRFRPPLCGEIENAAWIYRLPAIPWHLTEPDAKSVRSFFGDETLPIARLVCATCQPVELGEADLNTARGAFRTRNVDACKKGLPSCDPTVLNGPEFAEVKASLQQRRRGQKKPPPKP